mgnify:CR=1 FL=1
MQKGVKFRIDPNKEQQTIINQTLGCCRLIYNKALAMRNEAYQNGNKIGYSQTSAMLTDLKKSDGFAFLKAVDSIALQQSLRDLDRGFVNFFQKRASHPTFKSKHNHKKSYKTNFSNNIRISFENNKIKLPKLNWVKVKFHRTFSGKIKSAVISQNSSGKYYVSILIETENESTFLPSTNSSIGIDLGIKNLIITSNGDKFDNIYIIKKYEKKLAKEQRKLSKKVKYSKNYEKQRKKVAVIYEKIHNSRIDYLHKISHMF